MFIFTFVLLLRVFEALEHVARGFCQKLTTGYFVCKNEEVKVEHQREKVNFFMRTCHGLICLRPHI